MGNNRSRSRKQLRVVDNGMGDVKCEWLDENLENSVLMCEIGIVTYKSLSSRDLGDTKSALKTK